MGCGTPHKAMPALFAFVKKGRRESARFSLAGGTRSAPFLARIETQARLMGNGAKI